MPGQLGAGLRLGVVVHADHAVSRLDAGRRQCGDDGVSDYNISRDFRSKGLLLAHLHDVLQKGREAQQQHWSSPKGTTLFSIMYDYELDVLDQHARSIYWVC